MNIFKAIYCRVFQTAFRVMLPVLPYRNPEILKDYDDAVRVIAKACAGGVPEKAFSAEINYKSEGGIFVDDGTEGSYEMQSIGNGANPATGSALPAKNPAEKNKTDASKKGAVLPVEDKVKPGLGGAVLLVTDKGIRGGGLTKHFEDAITAAGINCVVFDKVVPNPTTDLVEEARALYIREGCSCLIGFGGGSSMDCAKAVGARIARPHKSLSQMKGILKVWEKIPPLIAVPTTAGTGSEATLAAVITDSATRHKYPINDFPLIPKYAVLDPEITRGLPPFLTATTGLDALTHAVEAYIGRSTTSETRLQSEQAVELIFGNLYKCYADGNDMGARANMLKAAYLAGCAFTRSYVGYVHAVAHSLGGKYDVPHGLANAVLLPFVLEDYGKSAWKKLKKLGVCAGVCDVSDSDEDGAGKFIAAIRDLRAKTDIPDVIPEIREEDIASLAKIADKEGNPLYPVPVLRNAKELERYYRMVM